MIIYHPISISKFGTIIEVLSKYNIFQACHYNLKNIDFPWCGLLINQRNLSIKRDYSKVLSTSKIGAII